MVNSIRTRFAPSPTGYMHVGNLRTALYAYLFARANDGVFVLRIEDTDQERYIKDAVNAMYRTLKSVGITHDEGPDVGGNYGPYIQSERKSLYSQYAEELVRGGHAYYCFCDKRNLDIKSDLEERIGYNRKCRTLSQKEIQEKLSSGESYVIRQKVPLSGVTSYDDVVYGHIEVENATLDDQILLKSGGMPTYNLANVIDDHLMKITHIIRGGDFISSTPKYQLLYDGFGWEAPLFVHLPLIMGQNEDGSCSKLSKRHGATSFEQLVDNGYLPQAITNYIALLGWTPKDNKELLSLDEMALEFSLSDVNKSSAIFDYKKLKWMNGEYIRQMNVVDFADVAKRFVSLPDYMMNSWLDIASLLKERVETFCEIQSRIEFLIKIPEYDKSLFINKKNKLDFDSSLNVLIYFNDILQNAITWEVDNLNVIAEQYAEQIEKKIGYVMWPLRIAVSGLLVTPGGATEIMKILGKSETLYRIKNAITLLSRDE